MSPDWALVALTALSYVGHLWLRARDTGRWEQRVTDLKEEHDRTRSTVSECQLVKRCEQDMSKLDDRIDNAHKRMDRHHERLDKHEDLIRELGGSVAALRGSKS